MKQTIPIHRILQRILYVLVAVLAMAMHTYAKPGHTETFSRSGIKAFADSAVFTLIVLDDNEAAVPNVAVQHKSSTTKANYTNASGYVRLRANKGDVVALSIQNAHIVDYILTADTTQTIILSSKDPIVKDNKNVRLLFDTSLPSNLTAASTEAVYTADLVKMPVTTVNNALAGRFAGLSTSQSSGQPGNDTYALNLHGQNPLVVIDGIARPISTLDLDEIESVTLLKDALATAMYGMRGSAGVLLITTKKGTTSSQRISFTAQTGFQQPLKTPQPLDAFTYATLRNEAVANEALVGNNYSNLLYSAADLQAYQTGSDPIGHPNINWGSLLLKQTSMLDRYSFNISGGSNNARYFVAFENYKQTGFLNTISSNNYNTNNEIDSYLVRSNIDIDITPKLTAGIHLFGRILNGNEPGATVASIYSGLLTTPDNAYPQFNPNGSYGGSSQYQNNLWAQSTGSGYLQSYTRNILADFSLKRSLDELLPGLYIKALGSFSSNITENINRSKTFATYQAAVSATTGAVTYSAPFGASTTQLNTNSISTQARQSYFELSMGYSHTFNDTHGLNFILLANTDNSVTTSLLPYTVSGTAGRFSYNYKEKYVAEAAFGLNGSNYFQTNGNTTYAFFPAFGLAWNINKEDFLKSTTWVNTLKLFASYGKTGNDIASYFPSIQRYNGTTAYFGTAAGATAGLAEGTLANPNTAYEDADKLNLGLKGTLLSDHLGFTAEYYNNKYYNLLIQRGQATSLLGASYPLENIGQNRYFGYDLQLTWQQTISQNLNYFITALAGIQNSKVLYSDEVVEPYSYMDRTGQRVGQAFGYTALGLIQTKSEAVSVPTFVGYTPQAGDIKYLDRNGDGVINQLDQAPIGTTNPPINFGLNLGFTFKEFDFSALFQGMTNRYVYLNGNGYWEFQNGGYGQAYQQQLNRWTPATAATATYPRLGIGFNTNNDIFSTYWYRNADYVRLKNIEVGYTLPLRYARFVWIKSARLFVNGTNMLTFTKLQGVDPEVSDGSYPIQKLFNVGINIKL